MPRGRRAWDTGGVSSTLRLRLDIAYDGAGFHGWARQRGGLRTVQGELEQALDTVLRVAGSALTVAGRTDTGVHARGQVAHLDVDPETLAEAATGREPCASLARRLNGIVDPDVRVRGVAIAPPGFDARFSAIWRRYQYRIADRLGTVDPLTRGHVLPWPRALDVEAMGEAAAALAGEHDFAAFCKKREGATTIRELLEFSWTRADGVAVATVRADAFCHHMVRALVGCMIAVGEGRRARDWPAAVLAARARDSAVTVVDPRGLTLEEVGYPAAAAMAERARASRALRTLEG